MADAFNIINPGTGPVSGMDQSGNIWTTGTVFAASMSSATTGASFSSGIQVLGVNSGDNTAAEAVNATITPTFAGGAHATGTQLSDVSRDYQLYLNVGTGGTNNLITIGNTSAATLATIWSAATISPGALVSFRVPAGFFVNFTGTATFGIQTGIGC